MRQMKPLLKNNPPNPYTWSYEFDTLLDGGHVDDGWNWHSGWWMSSCSCPFDQACVPFWVSKDTSLIVDWGDGTINTITGTSTKDYAASNATVLETNGICHTYTNPGTYTISVTSSQWDKIWLCAGDPGNGGFPLGGYPQGHWNKHYLGQASEMYSNPDFWGPFDCGFSYDSGFSDSITGNVAAMRMGCTKILNPLPPVAGVVVSDYIQVENTDRSKAPEGFFDGIPEFGTFLPNSLYYAFAYYIVLHDIPKNIFIYNQNANDFSECLWGIDSILKDLTLYNKNRYVEYDSSYIATL